MTPDAGALPAAGPFWHEIADQFQAAGIPTSEARELAHLIASTGDSPATRLTAQLVATFGRAGLHYRHMHLLATSGESASVAALLDRGVPVDLLPRLMASEVLPDVIDALDTGVTVDLLTIAARHREIDVADLRTLLGTGMTAAQFGLVADATGVIQHVKDLLDIGATWGDIEALLGSRPAYPVHTLREFGATLDGDPDGLAGLPAPVRRLAAMLCGHGHGSAVSLLPVAAAALDTPWLPTVLTLLRDVVPPVEPDAVETAVLAARALEQANPGELDPDALTRLADAARSTASTGARIGIAPARAYAAAAVGTPWSVPVPPPGGDPRVTLARAVLDARGLPANTRAVAVTTRPGAITRTR